MTPLVKASQNIGRVLKHDDIVVYEYDDIVIYDYTVYAGATEEVCILVIYMTVWANMSRHNSLNKWLKSAFRWSDRKFW